MACQVLSGGGNIRDNGGEPAMGGYGAVGGGEGRVALTYGDMSGFSGKIETKGGVSSTNSNVYNGGAGTVYLKQQSDAHGSLIVDNGGTITSGWSTPLLSQGILRLDSWTISGNARVSAPFPVHVTAGYPNYFLSLINSNKLQIGSLWINGQWVYGDFMTLDIDSLFGQPRVPFFTKPNDSCVSKPAPTCRSGFLS